MWDNSDSFDDLVTIARFSFPYQAYLLRGRLESEGIEAFVHQEDTSSVLPYLAVTKSGICVLVKQSEKENALAIMKVIEETGTPASDLPAVIRINGNAYDLVNGICAECSSASVYLARANDLSALGVVAVLITIQLPIKLDHNYICTNCQYQWKG